MFDFLVWWMTVLVIGAVFMPVTGTLFPKFKDGGWVFSKALGVFVSGYVMWVLSSLHLVKFRSVNCLIILIICLTANLIFGIVTYYKKGYKNVLRWDIRLILFEELLFLVIFGIWTYLVGFDPAAYGTEKFMDYGFMTSMMRTDYFPFEDPWYCGASVNYYYGGQYLASFLTKLSGISVGKGYNFMRTMLAAFSFVMPFSLVYHLLFLMQKRHMYRQKAFINISGGILAGVAVSFCGNMHYVLYGLIPSVVSRWTGETADYYYPDSTRFIGHNPVIKGDQTIHEFPSYSFVLGDLHAHVVNIMFVMLVLALAFSWAYNVSKKKNVPLKEALLRPELLWIGFFTGMFRWTNYWDFPIYFVTAGCVLFFVNIRIYRASAKAFWKTTLLQLAELLAVGFAAAIPFTVTFDKIASVIKLTYSHSPIYQLLILWGFPIVIVVCFVLSQIAGYGKKRKIVRMFIKIPIEDLFAALIGICGIGLVVLPELIYIEDIYSGAYRANTMFKLTYQAYILFGISMAYILTRAIVLSRNRVKWFAGAGVIVLLFTAGYGVNAINSRFGDITDPERYKGTDASVFVGEFFESDYGAVCWLNEHVTGQPVVLEAQGDSYTGYQRVSVATGLPTVLGWYVHEWLWRGETDLLNERAEDVEIIYTSGNREVVEQLIEQYDITYIYIGMLERQKYPKINDQLLQEIGEVAYSNGIDTYILKVQ